MIDIRHISERVRNFLFSSVNREFLIFLFFFTLAGIFWLLMTLNETYDKEVRIPTRIVNIPKNVVLTSDEQDTISVILRDRGLVLLSYEYGDGLKTIDLSFKDYERSNGYGMVTSTELQQLISKQLPASTSITEMKTNMVEYFYNNGISKRVPVRWSGQITPESPYFISNVEYYPDSVDIFAPKEKLDSLSIAYTVPLNYTDFHDSLTIEARLQKSKGVKTIPEAIKIRFITDILTEESFTNLTIKGINLPKGKTLRTFPSKVSVSFVTGVNRFKSMSAKDFVVVADFNDIASSNTDMCRLQLISVPEGISRATLNINEVDYVIEEDTALPDSTLATNLPQP